MPASFRQAKKPLHQMPAPRAAPAKTGGNTDMQRSHHTRCNDVAGPAQRVDGVRARLLTIHQTDQAGKTAAHEPLMLAGKAVSHAGDVKSATTRSGLAPAAWL
jgi:hypothetical protein